MTTATTETVKFLVTYKEPGKENLPGWKKVGIVKCHKRLVADKDVKSHFNSKTKFYDQVLSHCRFLLEESAARDVDFHLVGKLTGPKILYRIHKYS